MKKMKIFLVNCFFGLALCSGHSQTVLVSSGSSWKYLDNGSDQGTAWKDSSFNDAAWSSGTAPLGYGQAQAATTVSYGGNSSTKHTTTYFRKSFNIVDLSAFSSFSLDIKRDDGAVVYINGKEVFRTNMPASGTIAYNTFSSGVASDNGADFINKALGSSNFVNGKNVIAVSIHQANLTSSDIIFDLELKGLATVSSSDLVSEGATWSYLDNGTDQGTAWKDAGFNSSTWAVGDAALGYGQTQVKTVVSFGANSSSKYTTTYFRKSINIADVSLYGSYSLNIKRDDGAVVYVNGVEVLRSNMPTGTITYSSFAASTASDNGADFMTSVLPSNTFTNGVNVIAVSVHQANLTSSDVVFDLSLKGNPPGSINAIKHVRWGSSGDPLNNLAITWRNAGSNDSIAWGYTDSYEQGRFKSEMRSGYEDKFFTYKFPPLTPNSTIFYKLFDSQNISWSAEKTFTTAPPSNTDAFTFLGIGDSRSGLGIWQQISNKAKAKGVAFTVFTGDIVNQGGSNSDWNNWFDYGDQYVSSNLIYHSMGNHDVSSAKAYENIFELPKTASVSSQNAETNLYYSFNYGDAVFIALNSEDRTSTEQYQFLLATLEANKDKRWKVVFMHRPFYTIGSHAGEMNGQLSTWWKAFDNYGVDLILNGHDHMYERTKPLNRNVSTTQNVAEYGSGPTQGRCQIVTGGAGAPLYAGTPTWFIEKYQSVYNYCKFDVNGYTLCGTVLDNNDNVIDTFCLDKTPIISGIKNNNQKFNTVTVIPNPVVSTFKVEYKSENRGEAKIKVYDLLGKEIINLNLNKTEEILSFSSDMSKHSKGIYTLEINVGDQRDYSMVIVE